MAIPLLITAITNGAAVVICEMMPTTLDDKVQYIVVDNSAAAAGVMAHNFYGQLSEKVKIIGVTGTNGKTTIATLLFKLFSQLDYKCGLLSTVQNQIADKVLPSTHTTPDAITLNKLIAEMYARRLLSHFYGSEFTCYRSASRCRLNVYRWHIQ